jgi:hypothetical protein
LTNTPQNGSYAFYDPAQLGTVKDPEAVQRLVRLPALMETTAGISDIMVALIDCPMARIYPDFAKDSEARLSRATLVIPL